MGVCSLADCIVAISALDPSMYEIECPPYILRTIILLSVTAPSYITHVHTYVRNEVIIFLYVWVFLVFKIKTKKNQKSQ